MENNKGYTVKIKGGQPSLRRDYFCPICTKITGTIDDNCLQEYGFCKECYVMNVEDREVPLIDITKFKKKST